MCNQENYQKHKLKLTDAIEIESKCIIFNEKEK